MELGQRRYRETYGLGGTAVWLSVLLGAWIGPKDVLKRTWVVEEGAEPQDTPDAGVGVITRAGQLVYRTAEFPELIATLEVDHLRWEKYGETVDMDDYDPLAWTFFEELSTDEYEAYDNAICNWRLFAPVIMGKYSSNQEVGAALMEVVGDESTIYDVWGLRF